MIDKILTSICHVPLEQQEADETERLATLEERINAQEERATLDSAEKAAEAVAVLADGIGDRLKYKAQIAAVMEIITTEGLRIGKDIFEAIAGNPKYRLGPAPDEDG